jgi:hypothetical protein
MNIFLRIFNDLGYKKVVAIYDGDKKEQKDKDESQFPMYDFVCLCTDDIRDKDEIKHNAKIGITDNKGKVKQTYLSYCKKIIDEINEYFDK